MQIKTIKDLPESVTDILPEEGQRIYLSAYNNALERYYKEDEEGEADAMREEMAHREAWAAVEERFTQDGNRWVQKKEIG